MTRTREYLTEQLATKVDRHGVVVWADPVGEYRDVAAEVIPKGAVFERFGESWYEMRRRIEPQLGRADPRLIVYLDAEAPDEDPLEELRAYATEFKTRLITLLRNTMSGEFAPAKIDEIAGAAATLGEAEALIAGGAAGGPAQLVKTLKLHEPTDIVLCLASDGAKALKDDPKLIDEACSFLSTYLGADCAKDGSRLAEDIARHLLMVELAATIPQLPDSLASALRPVNAEQRQRCQLVLHRWKNDQSLEASFRQAMQKGSGELDLVGELEWHEGFSTLDTVPAFEDLAFEEYLRRLKEGGHEQGEQLALARLGSRWAPVGDQTREWNQRWQVAYAVAQLHRLISVAQADPGGSVAQRLKRYAETDWRIDQAHRRLELALLNLVDRSKIDTPVKDARRAYDKWLDNYLRRFTTSAETDGLAPDGLLLQGHIHENIVTPWRKLGPVVYFMVDALRFELGQDLSGSLSRQFDAATVEIQPAVGLVPSITPVGMANLCPGAEAGLELSLDSGDRLLVKIAGRDVMNPPQRMSLLQAAHGKVTDLELDDIFRLEDQELAERITGSNMILVRSREIDEAGESGKISLGLQGFDVMVQQLSRAVARLARHGPSRFVIASDHGFLALTREVGAHMVIPKPGGRGEVHRRAFVGRGGAAGQALLRMPLSKIGLPGDLDVIVPRGLALIASGGVRGFFHGGLSPQELITPVITVELEPPKGSAVSVIEAAIAEKITSHIFTAKLLLRSDLLSESFPVRPVAVRQSDGTEVGALATAGGAEVGEGLVRLVPGEEVTLGFRAAASLVKGDKIELQAYDARTDRRVAVSKKPATVARALGVEDELL